MPPDAIVKDFNILEDTLPGFCPGPVCFKINGFRFERMKERFHYSVIIAIARGAHAL
jgi:hypothetical protein